MSGFDMNFFEVGNPMYLGIAEELIEAQVNDAVDYIRGYYGDTLTIQEMEKVFLDFDINYPLLPHWLAVRFDEFDVV